MKQARHSLRVPNANLRYMCIYGGTYVTPFSSTADTMQHKIGACIFRMTAYKMWAELNINYLVIQALKMFLEGSVCFGYWLA